MPEPDWLLTDFIQEGGMTIVHGVPGAGKSLLVQDWSMVIANGWEWCGRETKKGRVLYLMGEGQGGLRGRILAWLKNRHTDGVPPVHWLMDQMSLWHTPGNDYTPEQHGLLQYIEDNGVSLFVVDTLAASFGGGNENMQQDMNQFVDFLHEVQDLGTATVVVHHEAKRDSGPRGSTVLKGTADTVIRLEPKFDANDRLILTTVRCKKQKDGMPFKRFDLAPVSHEVDTFRGEAVALKYDPGTTAEATEREQEMLDYVLRHQGTSWNDLVAAIKGSKSTLQPLRDRLIDQGFLEWGDDGKGLYGVQPEEGERL